MRRGIRPTRRRRGALPTQFLVQHRGEINPFFTDLLAARARARRPPRRQALSQSATEQAAALEELRSSMTEIGARVKAAAENAGQANRLMSTAQQAAGRGDQEMRTMGEAMGEIATRSQQIARVATASPSRGAQPRQL